MKEHAVEFMMDVFQSDGGPFATAKRLGAVGEFVFRKVLRSRLSAVPPGPELDAFVDHLAYMNCSCPVGTESALTAVFGNYLITRHEEPLIERVEFYEMQKYRTRINALQISPACEIEFAMRICLKIKICDA